MRNDMSVAERYTRIRVESGLPGRFIMRYINSGYNEKTYAELENGKMPSERINQRLVEMLHVNPSFLKNGEEPVFLDNSRMRDKDELIRERIKDINKQIRIPETLTIDYLVNLAEKLNVGWEYLLFGDEKCKDYPFDEQLEKDLNRNETVRRDVWRKMGVICTWDLEQSYQEIRLNALNAEGIKSRIQLLQKATGITEAEFNSMTGLSRRFYMRSEEEMERAKSLSLQIISETFHVSAMWLRSGDMGNCFYPCNYQMTLFLKMNPDVRKDVWRELYGGRRLPWSEKFTRIRKELNWPGTLMIEYMDIGYSRSMYSQIEHGRITPEDYLLSKLEIAFDINPDYLHQNKEPVLLDQRSKRGNLNEIYHRIKDHDMKMNYEDIKRVSAKTNNSIEWILCNDENAREWPFNDVMEEKLWGNEKLRKWIWEQMGFELSYLIPSGLSDTQGKRIKALMETERISRLKFVKMTGLSDVTVDDIINDRKKLSKLVVSKISSVTHYGAEWLESGNIERMRYPINFEFRQYLRNHPEIRHVVADKLMCGEER